MRKGRRGPVQQRKSDATRQRVIQAAIECIAEFGVKGATAARIARRAEVSWGGIQHQFGGKAGILDAVLQQVLEEYSSGVAEISTTRRGLAARVSVLVRGAWRLMCNPGYQAIREILHSRGESSNSPLPSEQITDSVNAAIDRVGSELFGYLHMGKAEFDLIKLFIFATLSGMIEQRRFAQLPDEATQQQLALLEQAVSDRIRRRAAAKKEIEKDKGQGS